MQPNKLIAFGGDYKKWPNACTQSAALIHKKAPTFKILNCSWYALPWSFPCSARLSCPSVLQASLLVFSRGFRRLISESSSSFFARLKFQYLACSCRIFSALHRYCICSSKLRRHATWSLILVISDSVVYNGYSRENLSWSVRPSKSLTVLVSSLIRSSAASLL